MNKNVLVTGIGGNVGQGILRNIIQFGGNIRLIGTNTTFLSGGNHLCDKVYEVPFSTEKAFIPVIKKICQEEKIDLIIPSTDYEIYFLSRHYDKLPQIVCSDMKTTRVFLNKYETYVHFNKYNIPFAETMMPSYYKDEYSEYIVKPNAGRGSRDVFLNPVNPSKFSDDFVVQKLYKGKEITTAFYVTKQDKLLGHITLERSLSGGATSECEVVFDYDKDIVAIINKMMEYFSIKGSCNIQSIVTKEGKIIPFEINCRVSGTNSIRSQFGFEDVRYILEEYLFNKVPKTPNIKKGSCIRILMDVIYPDIPLDKVKNKHTKHMLF